MTRIAPSENHPTQFQRESLDLINSLVALSSSGFYLVGADMQHRGVVLRNIEVAAERNYQSNYQALDPLSPARFAGTDMRVACIDEQLCEAELLASCYRASLALMRRLVPERNEVPNLLDDISTRAKIRGVNLAEVTPMPEMAGPAPFTTHMYGMKVVGHYDEIGEFLADIASLQRIIVPFDVTVAPAQSQTAKVMGDSTGALLEAKFRIRTYVKSSQAEGEASGI